jgi:Photosynthesis system II assembly factor YCF48/Putative zinc-finger
MEQLPKLVRDRLQGKTPGEHPDADLLTAYMEQSLTARERLRMDDHLAACSECRQIVVLAIPETTLATTAKQPLRLSGGWLRWPVLRWGALAACLAVVSGAVLLHFGKKPEALSSNSEVQRVEHAAPAATSPAAPQYEAKAIPPASQMVLVEPTPVPSKRKAVAGLAQGSGGGIGGGVYRAVPSEASRDKLAANAPAMTFRSERADTALAQNKPESPLEANVTGKQAQAAGANVGAPAAPPPTSSAIGSRVPDRAVSGASETVEVTAESPTLQTQTAEVAKQSGRDDKGVSKRVATTQSVVNFSPKPLPEVAANARNMVDFKVPRWTLSENGLPQRSFDSGASWEEVKVDHKSGFRTLSAVGMDIWVGGKSGLLYHSADMGLHWTQLTPAASGSTLTADVVRIEFADPEHGRVIAGDGQSWVTSDGGKNWERH